MSDDASPTRSETTRASATRRGKRDGPSSATRRGFLALAGMATLTGCTRFGGIGDVFEDEPPKIDGGALPDALSADSPTIPETVPVAIEQTRLDETATAVRELLSSVPAPFGSQEVPNGAIRAELTRMHDETNAALEDATDAPSPAETMARLRDARECARAVAAAWAAIDAGLTRADVRESVPAIREDVDAFRGRWRYVGDEPIRAVLVHGQIEELVAFASRRTGGALDRYYRRLEDPILVGEFAGALEEARAALDDAKYLYDRYETSLDDPRRIRSGLTAAGESLVTTLDDRRATLPDGDLDDPSSFVDRDVEGTPVGFALTELRRVDYADGLEDERTTGQRASIVLSVHETLVRIRSFELLRERVASDEHATVESADDVRAIRESAIEAVETAVESDANPSLDRRVLSQIVGSFEYVDTELDRYDESDEVSVEWLQRDLGRYVLIGAMARATPPTSAEVTDVIRREL